MFKISVRTQFSSAHKLDGYPGDCARIHGHCWIVEAHVAASSLNPIGIGFDFRELKDLLNTIIKPYDHQLLNEIPPFTSLNPTSENLARHFFKVLQTALPPHVNLLAVAIKESDNYTVTYSED